MRSTSDAYDTIQQMTRKPLLPMGRQHATHSLLLIYITSCVVYVVELKHPS